MGTEALVTDRIADGAEFLKQLNETIPITVALWIKLADARSWYLYVASEQFEDGKFIEGYHEVFRILGTGPTDGLDPISVRLIRASDPIAVDALKFRESSVARRPKELDRTWIGDVAIDGAVVYPK